MKGKNFKFLLPIVGFLILFFVIVAINKHSDKPTKPTVVTQNKSEKSKPSKEVPEENTSKENSEISLSTLDDFKAAYEKEDTPDILYGGNNLSMDVLNEKQQPVMVNFTWIDCEPCKIFDPLLQETYRTYHDKIFIKDVEVTVDETFAAEVGIRVTPSQLFMAKDLRLPKEFSNRNDFYETSYQGKSVIIHEGMLEREELETMIGNLLHE